MADYTKREVYVIAGFAFFVVALALFVGFVKLAAMWRIAFGSY